QELAQQLSSLRSDTRDTRRSRRSESPAAGASAPGGAAGAAAGAAVREGLRGVPFQVAADIPTHSLVLSGSSETIDAVLDAVGQLDRVPASVRVEITVAQVDLDDQLDLAVDFFIPTLTNPKAPGDLIATVAGNPSGGGIPSGPTTSKPFIAA